MRHYLAQLVRRLEYWAKGQLDRGDDIESKDDEEVLEIGVEAFEIVLNVDQLDYSIETVRGFTPILRIDGTSICFTVSEIRKNLNIAGRAGVMRLAKHKTLHGKIMDEQLKREALNLAARWAVGDGPSVKECDELEAKFWKKG